MRAEPLSVILLCASTDASAPWAPVLVQEHLRRLGHLVETRSHLDVSADVVHAMGWGAGRIARSSAPAWVLTPGADMPADAEQIVAGADAVLVASNDHATEVNRLGVPHYRIHVLPPAVDCSTFTRLGPMANRTDRFRVVAPLSRDGEAVVRAIDAMRYTPEAELIAVAAPGRAVLPEKAERLATEVGMRSRVAVVQARDERERAWWLRSAHAALSLDDTVPHPAFVAEAMACGTPVVTTPIDAQRELVVHGITGFHVPAGRPVSAAGALREIFADEFRVEAFGMAASDRAMSSLDWPRVVQGMEAVYRRALGSRGGAAGTDADPDADASDGELVADPV
jgi:glycosyltransferase involved in cell wall biosynthesis